MADFAVDYRLLQQTEKALTGLKNEFGHIDAVPKAASWGHGDISSAMDGFAGNWSHHRASLLSSMEALLKNVQQTISETQQYDSSLQHQLTKK